MNTVANAYRVIPKGSLLPLSCGSENKWAQLLPKQIIVRECLIANVTGRLFPEEEQFVKSAVPKRQQEFLAGRSCAREALSVLGVPPTMLLVNEDRTPTWPRGVVGSITHSTQYCAVAVGFDSAFANVGIDIEEISRFDAKLLPLICTKRELRILDAMSISERQVAAAIFLSAKESIYKCQYMLTRSWLGFHSLEIDFEPGSDEFRSRLLEDVAGCRRGRYLGGRYASSNDIVTTAVVISTDTAGVEGKLGKAFRRDLR